jgi:hypothetical protein
MKTRQPLGHEPPDPLVAGRRRASLCLCGRRHAPPEIQDAFDEQPTTFERELRSSMSHESLPPDRFHPVEQGGPHLLNNVLGNYT